MSGAIGGYICLSDRIVEISEERFYKNFNKYKLDEINSIKNDKYFMIAGLLHVTNEDKEEVIPYYSKEDELIITADAIIDNREELIQQLNLKIQVTDSKIILESYKKWGQDCCKYILGDYAFVIYNIKNNEVFCARDHVGGRILYYKIKDNIFYFSTLINPIKEDEELNERWITDFLAMPSVMNQSEGEETIYKNIYQLPAATTLFISDKKIVKNKYWDVFKSVKKYNFKSDEEYEAEFRRIFTEAVRCRLRCDGNIAVKLSGGLDSSSVACIASNLLKKRNQNLKSFTAIPLKKYDSVIIDGRIIDEREYVESIKDITNNIEFHYCDYCDKDAFSEMNKYIDILEQPFKNYQNLCYGNDIMEKAHNLGCKVILTGQFGNFTISYGSFITHLRTLANKHKYIEIAKEIDEACKYRKVTRKFAYKALYKSIIPNIFIKNKSDLSLYNNSPVNKELLKKWNFVNRVKKNGFDLYSNQFNDIYDDRKFIMNSAMFAQIGITETKLSLYHGIMQRDPTKDKRIIEFCFSLPSNQFARGGKDRYLLRRAMKNIIPDKIRLNDSTKGLQSYDWIERMIPREKEICAQLQLLINDKELIKYFDKQQLIMQLNNLRENSINDKSINIRMILTSLSLYNFLKGGEENYERME